MKKTGIYTITCINNGAVYVGQTKDYAQRVRYHRFQLNHKEHGNRFLQRLYDKYGEDSLKYELLFECGVDVLDSEEKRIFDLVKLTSKVVVNSRVDPVTNRGVKRTPEMNLAHSKRMKGKKAWNNGVPCSNETKAKLSLALTGRSPWNKGTPQTEDCKLKLSLANKGKPSWNKGKSWSKESKLKMSLAKKGKPFPGKAFNVAGWNKGLKWSKETKVKMSIAAKSRWNKELKIAI